MGKHTFKYVATTGNGSFSYYFFLDQASKTRVNGLCVTLIR